ncbi:MAG: response regulator [Deltaproteobacteria bacterium]|jgi:CheY-like chemotaxis protein|nr:response regulator [Deltaproteobacteria bacterium]
MIKNVLLVDDDTEMLHALKGGLKRYQESFAVLLAEDGLKALEILKQKIISLVVTDLKMPNMDGFELLAHIMQYYPDIPVIIITGYSTPEMEHLAREGGAVGYIAKPFLIENLARQILTTLRKESEGGTLHNISSGMFLQLIEMEQKTCTIRLEEKSGGKKGILFFSDGELFDARINNVQGEAAAHEIFSWDAVNLSIQNGCALKENRIQSDLQPLILEAMRRKDEKAPEGRRIKDADEAELVPEGVMEQIESAPETAADRLNKLKAKIEAEIGQQCGLEDLYQDSLWDYRVSQLSKIGAVFRLGEFMLAYIDRGDAHDYILIPGQKTTVVTVDPRCPRDKILRAISN